jgi:hypothetical protein
MKIPGTNGTARSAVTAFYSYLSLPSSLFLLLFLSLSLFLALYFTDKFSRLVKPANTAGPRDVIAYSARPGTATSAF